MFRRLIVLIAIIIVYKLFTDISQPDGTCNETSKVNFRGINFQFPLKVRGVLKTPMSGFTRNYTWIETDSIGNRNISGKWFFNRDSEWNIKQELSSEAKEKLIYGVAFELHDDSCKTDQEIVAEIQEMYPGNYTYTVEWGYKYYVWERDCLTIFVKRTYDDPEGNSIPEVSFCYGISSSEASTYGKYTGYINGFPD